MPELIADVAVNAPLKQLFSYRVPEESMASAQVGVRVRIPFGRRSSTGIIANLRRGQAGDLKDISQVLDNLPLFPAPLVELLRWAAEYYCFPVGQVMRNALPGSLGSGKADTPILTEQVYRATPPDVPLKGRKQIDIHHFISTEGPIGLERLRREFPAPYATLARLVELGCLTVSEQERLRDPFLTEAVPADRQPALNAAQQKALAEISETVTAGFFCGFLLHGVTGSGKTEVYLQAVDICLSTGKQALILVPEIALTPQLVGRFRARFESRGVRIAALHSGLSDGERYDAWREIVRDQVGIVIGARSAVFAPLANPGLIVVDEEHDASYKQGEGFRYNARDLALMRGKQQHCPVVLGSATPSFSSYHRSCDGALRRLTLDKRVHDGNLPAVELIDLKEQVTEGSLANPLIEAIQEALARREQALLLLNRRGFAPFLLCTDCGATFRCPNCEISLTYHQRDRQLRCHYCDFSTRPPESCDKCQGLNIEPQGAGTEKLELELAELFPTARIARMDRDTTSRKGAHRKIMTDMLEGRIDLLVGTQMIAKGHDFPRVSVVGVLGADNILNFPDFRSAERCFALLTQVAGRAGREKGGGQVFIQSFNPQHYALTCAAEQDYEAFYRQELVFRQELGYPPCGHLVNLVFAGNNEAQVRTSAERFARALIALPGKGVEVLGPGPCPLARLRGRTRYQILLKSAGRPQIRRMLQQLDKAVGQLPRQVQLAIDVDPLDML